MKKPVGARYCMDGEIIDFDDVSSLDFGDCQKRHLCFDCQKARADRCSKVADRKKRPIENYPFITVGIEVNELNVISRGGQQIKQSTDRSLYVFECQNFRKDVGRPEALPRKKIKQQLKKGAERSGEEYGVAKRTKVFV